MNLIKKLYLFQSERFPLRILIFTTISSVLASSAVSGNGHSIFQIGMAFLVTLFFLFHIRVIDESRDLEMDTQLHPERPVQKGIISLKELFVVDVFGLIICFIAAIYFGFPSIFLTIIIIAFTSLAWKDFFCKSFFTRRPILYHIINSPQMILIQWNIYAIFTKSFTFTLPMVIQLVLVYNGIFIIEIVRKIKIPQHDTIDSYSSRLGTRKAVNLVGIMFITGYALFVFLLHSLHNFNFHNLLIGALMSCLCMVTLYIHGHLQRIITQKVMIFLVVAYYVILNLTIYKATC